MEQRLHELCPMQSIHQGGNRSSLDGWWTEEYDASHGWKVGNHQDNATEVAQDAGEAEQLYSVLENGVISFFYKREPSAIASEWVAMMRERMARLTVQYSANRSVHEYAESFYLPAAEVYAKRKADHGKLATELCKWQTELRTHWFEIHFREIESSQDENESHFKAGIYLGDICPEQVHVDLYADNVDSAAFVQTMSQVCEPAGVQGGFSYEATVPGARPASDYAFRIVAALDTRPVPLEEPPILRQRQVCCASIASK